MDHEARASSLLKFVWNEPEPSPEQARIEAQAHAQMALVAEVRELRRTLEGLVELGRLKVVQY